MVIFLVIFALCFILYLNMIQCRRNHPDWNALEGWSYAHRGLHNANVPENSMAAFRAAKEAGYGIELDVHLMADGNLAVIHDASLKRTAGADILIEDMSVEQLQNYTLEATQERIPLLQQVLELYNGEAPLIIELKSSQNNYGQLCQCVCQCLENYSGAYCLESFDPRCIFWLRKNCPDVIRGQLAENFLRNTSTNTSCLLRFALTCHLLNFLTKPDFIAYNFHHRDRLGNVLCRKFWGAKGVTWTLRSKEEYDIAVSQNWIPIFEGFMP